MKQLLQLLLAFACFWAAPSAALAQNENEIDFDAKQKTPQYFNEVQGYRTLGLDFGFSYQSSDVRSTSRGWGLGLTYELNRYHRPNGFVDFGWRGRFNYANSIGMDAKKSFGFATNPAVNGTYNSAADYRADSFYYANYRNDMAELAAEAVLTFNRLREKRGVYLTLFGGVGGTWYDVKVDQLDANGAKYNYKSITTPSVSVLRSFRDGTFETPADGFGGEAAGGKIGFTPRVGAELGFHLTPRFLVALGHKWTFTGTDVFDGQQYGEENPSKRTNDWHHYTNLQLKWIIGDKSQNENGEPPKITFTRPITSPYTSTEGVEIVRANLKNVVNEKDVTFTVNGRNVPFTFYRNYVYADVKLDKGNNEVVIRARNEWGSDERSTVIYYLIENRPQDPTPTVLAPRVRITQPNGYRETEETRQTVRATVENVSSYEQLNMTVNGRPINYQYVNGDLSAEVNIAEGRNVIVVAARNSAGESRDEVTVVGIRTRPQMAFPFVRINNVDAPMPSGAGCRTNFSATVQNVQSSRDIAVTVNGRAVFNFNFDANAQILRGSADLASGGNRLVVVVRNAAGEARDEATVNCQARPPVTPPTVRITQPGNGQRLTQPSVDVRAVVDHVQSREQIQPFINGNPVYNYNFSTFDRSVTFRANLNEGDNTIAVRVNNQDGSDESVVRVNYRRPVNPPSVVISRPNNGATLSTPSVQLVATVQGVANRNQVRVLFNGADLSNFNFDNYNQTLTVNANLRDGANTFVVRATNDGGTDEKSVRVNYLAPIEMPQPPKVNVVSPANNAVVTNPTVELRAGTTNIFERNQIQVNVNGADAPNFEFDKVTRTVRLPINLAEGQNTFSVRVANKDGQDQNTVTVTYKRPIPPPSVRFIQPARLNRPVTAPQYTVRVAVANVSNPSEVVLRQNGQVITNAQLNNGELTAAVNLAPGENNFVCEATTAGGKANASANVALLKAAKDDKMPDDKSNGEEPVGDVGLPVVNNLDATLPIIDVLNPKPAISNVTATIVNGETATIEFFIDDAPVTNFNFNKRNGGFSYSFEPKAGKAYTFRLKVTNGAGSDEKTKTIQY